MSLRTGTGLVVAAAWLGGSVACVESTPRAKAPAGEGGTDGVAVLSCEGVSPVPFSGNAVIPSEDTAPPGPYLWKNVVIKGGGFVSGVTASPALPGLVFARTDVGGAYRRDPVNRRWMPITDWVGRNDGNLTGIESIAADPVDPNRVYIAAGQYLTAGSGFILSSTDMGRTWAPHSIGAAMGGNVNGRSMGERLAIDPNLTSTLYFASRTTGLWKSTDSAQTWSAVANFPTTGAGNCGAVGMPCGLTFVVFDTHSGSAGSATPVIYVGVGATTGSALYRSTDAGATWEPVAGQPAGMMPHHAVVDSCGNLYLTYNDWAGPNDVKMGAVWRYTMGVSAGGEQDGGGQDGGQQDGAQQDGGEVATDIWTDVSPPRQTGGFGGIAIDVAHPQTLLVTTIDLWYLAEVYRTTDGGAHWTAISRAGTRSVAGAEWLWWHGSNLPEMGWMGDVELDPFDPSRAFYITGQGIWSSDDVTAAAPSWRFDDDGLEETVPLDLASPPSGPPLLTALGDIAGFRHDDLDVSPPDGMFGNPTFGNTSSLDFAESDPNIVVRVGTNSSTGGARGAYSMDGGRTWMPFAGAPESTSTATPPARPSQGSIAVSADGITFVWAPRDGRPSYSRDRGATWTACAGYTSGTRVYADRVNPAKFYASGGNRAYVSTDGGATFTQAGAVASTKLRPVFGIEGELWAASTVMGMTGLYRSKDSGATWTQLPQISNAAAVGFGMAAPGQSYPAVYISAQLNNTWGVYRCDNVGDGGTTWQRIDDDQHQFGYVTQVAGDQRQYGRVYIGTGGRGVLYGDPR